MTEAELMTKHPELQNIVDAGMRPGLIAYIAYQIGAVDHCMEMANRVGIPREKLDQMAAKGAK